MISVRLSPPKGCAFYAAYSLRTRSRDFSLRHAGHRRARQAAARRGHGRDRFFRRRAGLLHAGIHQRRGQIRHRRGHHALHARGGHAGSAPENLRKVPSGQRRGLHARGGDRLQRREAVHLHSPERAAQSRRRGASARALLAELSRDGAHGRRRAGDGARLRGEQLRRHRRHAAPLRHRQDEGARHQHAQQPQRLHLEPRGASGHRRSGRGARLLRHLRRDLRKAHLRR